MRAATSRAEETDTGPALTSAAPAGSGLAGAGAGAGAGSGPAGAGAGTGPAGAGPGPAGALSAVNRTDVAVAGIAAAVGAWLLLAAPGVGGDSRLHPSDPLFLLDAALGGLACLSLLFRRRWPVAVGLVTVVPQVLALSGGAAALLAVLNVASLRRARVAVTVAAAHQAAMVGYWWRWSDAYPFWAVWLWSLTEMAGLVVWGMYLRTRRELVGSLRERADRAEAEQKLMAEQARLAERTRIAREMHDVLAHRVSLVALHAGGLEVRPDLSPDSVRETARLIRGTARQALEELRDVIGVLRDPTGSAGDGRGGDTRGGRPAGAGTAIGTEEVPSAPQPTLRDVPRLVEESRQAGMHVELSMLVEEVDEAPGPLGRDTYRIVREALTNVGKHARGTATTVSVSGRPGDGLRVVVRNRLPHRPPVAPLPGSGVGLVGLTERVAIAGGTLTHGPNADGDFVVDAELRWAQ